MNYYHYEFNTKKRGLKESVLRLYPLVCMHLGAQQCDYEFIKEHVRRIEADPNGRWIYMGDGGECVTKLSKGNIYGQLMSPRMQLEAVVDLLKPVLDKGLFGIRGNHGHRVYKETGLSFDHTLCARLGIPYLGFATFANFLVNRSSYDCYLHHGSDSGVSLSAKIAKAEAFGRFIDADAILTAHSHVAMELQPSSILGCDNNAQKVRTKLRHQYICGSAYDSRSGYAEEKGYPPLLPSYIVIELDGRIVEGTPKISQSSRIYRSDGQRFLDHSYATNYIDSLEC